MPTRSDPDAAPRGSDLPVPAWVLEKAARRGCHAVGERFESWVELGFLPTEGAMRRPRTTRFDAVTYADAPDSCWRAALEEHELKYCLR
jgi:hypothetical protein